MSLGPLFSHNIHSGRIGGLIKARGVIIGGLRLRARPASKLLLRQVWPPNSPSISYLFRPPPLGAREIAPLLRWPLGSAARVAAFIGLPPLPLAFVSSRPRYASDASDAKAKGRVCCSGSSVAWVWPTRPHPAPSFALAPSSLAQGLLGLRPRRPTSRKKHGQNITL